MSPVLSWVEGRQCGDIYTDFRGYCSTRSKDIAQHRKDAEASENMDAIIDLWTKMLEADQVHDEKIVGNVQIMQQQADTAVKILQENLAKLHAISLTSVVGAGRSSLLARRCDSMHSLRSVRSIRLERGI